MLMFVWPHRRIPRYTRAVLLTVLEAYFARPQQTAALYFNATRN
jgi:hypothetical protein